MRRFPRLIALVALLVPCLALGACGSASDSGGFDVLVGPGKLALPVFGDGSIKTLALRNMSGTDATATPSPFSTVSARAAKSPSVASSARSRVSPCCAARSLAAPS